MSSSLECDSCTFSTPDLQDAMEHVGASLGHVMSVETGSGSTITVALNEEEIDSWDEGEL